MFLEVTLAVVLLCNGMAAGVLVASELAAYPLMARLPADQYVRTHAFFSTRYDPFMPISLVLTVLGDLLLGVAGSGAASVLHGAAALCAAAAIGVALTRNVPLNIWVRAADPDDPPPDWRDRRTAWGMWNRLRCLLVVAALVANCATVAIGR